MLGSCLVLRAKRTHTFSLLLFCSRFFLLIRFIVFCLLQFQQARGWIDLLLYLPPPPKKRKVDESKLTPLPTTDGSVLSGMRGTPTGIRWVQQQHPLSLFERYLATLRSRQFKILDKNFHSSLESIKHPSATNANKSPDHEDYSQVEMVAGQYQILAKEITTRFGGETTGNEVTFGLNDTEQLGFPNMGITHSLRVY
jgi:hypothetical protein